MYAGQPSHGEGDVAIGGGVIGGPTGAALLPVASITHAVAWAGRGAVIVGVHQAGENPLGFLLIIGGNRDVVLAGILAPGHLPGECATQRDQRRAGGQNGVSQCAHAAYYNGSATSGKIRSWPRGKRRNLPAPLK